MNGATITITKVTRAEIEPMDSPEKLKSI